MQKFSFIFYIPIYPSFYLVKIFLNKKTSTIPFFMSNSGKWTLHVNLAMCLALNKGVTNFHRTFAMTTSVLKFSFYSYDACIGVYVCVTIHLRFHMLNLRVHFTTMFDPIVLNIHTQKKNLMNCSSNWRMYTSCIVWQRITTDVVLFFFLFFFVSLVLMR